MEEQGKAEPSEIKAYLKIKKRNPDLFSENHSQLDNPSLEDKVQMDILTLEELKEGNNDSQRTIDKKFHELINRFGVLVSQPISNETPTEFIADMINESTFDIFDDS
jgi:hypothetical protein